MPITCHYASYYAIKEMRREEGGGRSEERGGRKVLEGRGKKVEGRVIL